MKDEKDNFSFVQDVNANEKNIIYKIFRYFYSLFQEKREFNSFFKYIQILIETIQFISYAFSSIHYNSWKLEQKNIKIVSYTFGAFRISILMEFLDYKLYTIILYILVAFIFIISLVVLLQIIFLDSTSKKYKLSSTIIRSIIDIIVIILYIPIIEIILLPIRCIDGKVYGIKNSETCWENIHYLNAVLGIIGAFMLFIWCTFTVFFSFYPFQKIKSTIRISSSNDIIIITMKLFLILQYLLISDEYISLFILLLISIIIFVKCFNESTYNSNHLEMAINMKNLIIIWTYFVLFLSKFFLKFKANGFIYLLLFGYPLIIYLSIIIIKEKDFVYFSYFGNANSLNDYIKIAKINIKLIDSFIDSQNIRNNNEKDEQKNIIFLKGNIKYHILSCDNKDCPLVKFLNNEGNYNIQRQNLLNYMNIFFNKAFKKFPNSIYLLILYIQFNYNKRFNLNNVKAKLLKLKTIKSNTKEKYIIYCMEQNINNNIYSRFDNNKNGENNDSQIDINNHKYQKLKYLIENSIKLYAEFWGIFSTNITSIINTSKLHSIGKKLNIYLNEINNLWDNELKNKKINNENQNIVQLYSKFLLEILLDRKKNREICKKLNYDNIDNYHSNDNKDFKEKKNIINYMDYILNNQDYIIFCDSDEKGNCKIIECSLSLSNLLGYEKYLMIGKSLELVVPNILIEAKFKYITDCIKNFSNEQNNKNDIYQENDSNKNSQLILIKSRMGYIYPLFAFFNALNDNDYSDKYLLCIKMEKKQLKSEYAYYVLTSPDLIIENISSSAINLGLSLDLLKKYIVKMDILVRTDDDKALNIYEDYNKYEEEPKIVTWVYPGVIYPKDNNLQNKDEEIEELIEKSKKNIFYLQINVIKFNENYNNLAFLFKFTEIVIKKSRKINYEYFIPKTDKNLVMYDLLELRYIRTLLVKEKTGLRNLRNKEDDKDKIKEENKVLSKFVSSKKKVKYSEIEEEDISSDDSERIKDNFLLTKEKIIELQGNNYIEIKNFIFSLPIYGSDIGLEKFRPNGDKYSASKITEPLIKIQLSNFCKKMDNVIHSEKAIKRKRIKIINNNIESPNSSNTNDYLFSTNSNLSESLELSKQNLDFHKEENNKEFTSDSFSSLSNIFKSYSINYIKILINIAFISTFLLIIIEFLLSYNYINKAKSKIDLLYNGYKILNNILYTKYFVTEAVIGNSLNMNYMPVFYNFGLSNFLKNISNGMSKNRQEFSQIYDTFSSNELCKEYKTFMKNTKINIYTLTLNKSEINSLLFNSAMSRIPSAINNLISNPNLINMNNRDTYELMHNLINEYYINWKKAVIIILNDSIKVTKLKFQMMSFFISYFIFSVVIFIIYLKLLSKFSIDREKPINLFLTIKKQVFENLKTSAENFSNKLLNKFFGNEDNEEESQQDYNTSIQSNDININKFKAANEYNYSIKKGLSFISIIIIIVIFILINLIYFVIKYFDFRTRMDNIFQFISLFNKTNIAHSDCILSFNIFKSYLFNKSIPILNQNNTFDIFISNFLYTTNEFEDTIILSSKSTSFLNLKY